MHVFDSPAALDAAVGTHLGFSPWRVIDQATIDAFSDATDDHQWIHVAGQAEKGPFGGPIAHGYLTLSLLPSLGREVYAFSGFRMGINYGLDKVRFPAVVPAGARVRMGVEVASVTDVAMGKRVVFTSTIELEGSEKPACVADAVVVVVP